MKDKPNISSHLLWEYNLNTFDYDKSYRIVIERILERGDLHAWKEMIRCYSKERILETIDWSAQLGKREKEFAFFFLDSDILYAV